MGIGLYGRSAVAGSPVHAFVGTESQLPENPVFHLRTDRTSYVMAVQDGYLAHLHWGAALTGHAGDFDDMLRVIGRCSFSPTPDPGKPLSLDTLPQEFPVYGTSDMRFPAMQVRFSDGSSACELKYATFRLINGKPCLEGLPAVLPEEPDGAETLEIDLVEPAKGLTVTLSYCVMPSFDVIIRTVRVRNDSSEPVVLAGLSSAAVDFDCGTFDAIHLQGAWARERHIERYRLQHGAKLLESRRGHSSHEMNPFFALLSPDATEETGDAHGFSLVYSGSFTGVLEVGGYGTTRAILGLPHFDFGWNLLPGDVFQAPEVVMVHSSEGIGGMSRRYHRLFRARLCRGVWKDKRRPVLVNNWEATYFDFTEDKLVRLAEQAKSTGIELLVMDDGWFGKRNDDHSSLGDWFVNLEKLPDGLSSLVDRVHEAGVGFGIWFEPEMISPDSNLYREHPDWCIHVPGRRRTEGRTQLVLDMSRTDVCDWLIETISGILSSAPFQYVKWDFNRSLTEIGSAQLPAFRQRETAHRFLLGTYRVLEELTSRFPKVLFEGCSGGGGRFDPGMLHYSPQIWTSDDSDAVERLKIQYGTSIVYPFSAMGAHVSAVPNHQCGRVTPLSFRGHAAFTGAFGYELDLERLSEEEKKEISLQTAQYKIWGHLPSEGDLYRLRSPFEGSEAAWMFAMPDRSEALALHFRVLARPNPEPDRLRLAGLDPDALYEVTCCEGTAPTGDAVRLSGSRLMAYGCQIPFRLGDFASTLWHVKRVEE